MYSLSRTFCDTICRYEVAGYCSSAQLYPGHGGVAQCFEPVGPIYIVMNDRFANDVHAGLSHSCDRTVEGAQNPPGVGAQMEFDARVIGLELSDLRHAPTRIGVAFGEEKITAIAGALAGNYLNMLVTDVQTATSLLAYPSAAEPSPGNGRLAVPVGGSK